jgi:hypothetical protein
MSRNYETITKQCFPSLPQPDQPMLIYVDILDETLSRDELHQQILEFITRPNALKACDYCSGFNIPVSAGIQTARPLPYVKYD